MHGATQLSEKAKQDLAEAVNYFEAFLGETEFAACDHLTIADIALLASASTFQVIIDRRVIKVKASHALSTFTSQATDSTIFDNHPKIQAWLEKCKAEIPDYNEANQKGADAFGEWAKGALAKLSE